MGKIVKRFNFETNSSSMHSLSFRRTEEKYTQNELMRSEAMIGEPLADVIITVNDDRVIATAEEMKSNLWIWRDELHFSSYELDFIESPMEVLADMRGKLKYAIASAMVSENSIEKIEEIKAVFNSLLPDVKLDIKADNNSQVYARGRRLSGGVGKDILYPFLKTYGISLRDFLIRSKYIVIVDYAEYLKMKDLGMVDESNIINVYPKVSIKPGKINIENGVWKIEPGDLSFGRSPFRVLGTVEGKARYALATYNSKNIVEVTEVLQEVYPTLERIELPKDDYEDDGVDHGYCDDSAYPCEVPLRDFILNKRYVIISDGDEYCVWDDFKKTKLFNRANYPNERISEDEYGVED
jgi:hypothetical protein